MDKEIFDKKIAKSFENVLEDLRVIQGDLAGVMALVDRISMLVYLRNDFEENNLH